MILFLAERTIQGSDVAWANQTTLHPLGLLMTLVFGVATLVLPRKYAGVPMLIMACFIAPAQRLVIAGLDFNLLRIMVLFGWLRLLSKNEFQGFRWILLDKFVLVWTAVGTVIYVLQQGHFGALVFKLGMSFDAIGMYFLYRCLVRSIPDAVALMKALVLISVPVALFLLLERSTGRNVFSVFGGVPAITIERWGKLRAQGAFGHAILAGTFWAALLPTMFVLCWRDSFGRLLAAMGVATTIFIVIACASSTPIAAMVVAVVGGLAWPLRKHMQPIRWSMLAGVIGLHIIMKAPVWHLIGRIDLVGGSTGYHRYRLIDAAVNNFWDWALLGTTSTAGWGYYLFDVTNQYILEGVRGGFVTMVLFIVQIGLAFAAIGRLRRAVAGSNGDEAFAWGLGVSLFVHCCAFIAVSYFGQIFVIWYLLLAIAASLDPRTNEAVAPRRIFVRSRGMQPATRRAIA